VVVQKVGVKTEANCLFINENLDYLRVKCSNLHSQTKEQNLLVLFKTKKISKYVVTTEMPLSGNPDT